MMMVGGERITKGSTSLPPAFSALADQFPPTVRSLLVDNVEPSTVAVSDLLSDLNWDLTTIYSAWYDSFKKRGNPQRNSVPKRFAMPSIKFAASRLIRRMASSRTSCRSMPKLSGLAELL